MKLAIAALIGGLMGCSCVTMKVAAPPSMAVSDNGFRIDKTEGWVVDRSVRVERGQEVEIFSISHRSGGFVRIIAGPAQGVNQLDGFKLMAADLARSGLTIGRLWTVSHVKGAHESSIGPNGLPNGLIVKVHLTKMIVIIYASKDKADIDALFNNFHLESCNKGVCSTARPQ